jgi:hypothetical protein
MRGAARQEDWAMRPGEFLCTQNNGVIVAAGNHSTVQHMSDDRIDFISSYCDRWCDRCAYTERCSAYACHIAIEMCGDA